MKAKLLKPDQSEGRNYGGDKELINAISVVGTYKGTLREVVTVRCYKGRSSSATVYASIWARGSLQCSGHGSAGGYGYHKESAAIAYAITSAGIGLFGSPYADREGMVYQDFPNPEFDQATLDSIDDDDARRNYTRWTPRTLRKLVKDTAKTQADISGCGDSAVESALLAIAKLAGARGKLIIVKH